MSSEPHTPKDAPEHDLERLWHEIHKVRYGMLGLTGSSDHFQPMAAFCEPETADIWFFTRSDTQLAKGCIGGAPAMFIVQSKDQAFHACIGGALEQHRDGERIQKYWNPIVAAWYPAGKDDPLLTLLRFTARDAQVWLSETNPIRFFWEIAKSNVTHHEPDVGASRPVLMSNGERSF
ncbi:MAG TPA: pyridoxamine 5'-phosphate oxidase family protein [Caulobacteraceae bacterium]|nr:pyridoxamine 5'-phosphate oxidase family protein [Caulobacteraceae bacterium]